ncbi:MAG: LysR substrate-binding domain-containing protein [Pseudomonadota bacterium]
MHISSLKTVLLVQQIGSIAGAARLLDMDASTVSRIVAGVEQDVGLRIFDRTTRRIRPTEAGMIYLNRIRPLIDDLDAAGEAAQSASATPRGLVRMTASVAFAIEMIVPLLRDFHTRYPDITVELLPSDANLDLLDHGLDLAIRLAAAPAGDLISTRVMSTRYRVVASPSYVKRSGPLPTPGALTERNCLRFALPDFRNRWVFRPKTGTEVTAVQVQGSTLISNALALRDAARAGLGISLLADWLIGEDLRTGALVDLLPTWDCTATSFETGAFLLYPSRAHLPQKTRVMIDFLKVRLAQSEPPP